MKENRKLQENTKIYKTLYHVSTWIRRQVNSFTPFEAGKRNWHVIA